MAEISISGWPLNLVIGVYDHEKTAPQALLLDLVLSGDWTAAEISDHLEDALDYKQLHDDLAAHLAGTRFELLERLTAEIGRFVLARPGVQKVTVKVSKPAALAPALVAYTSTYAKELS